MRTFVYRSIAAIALLACAALPARGADTSAPGVAAWFSEAQFLLDNDMLARTDRYYTNGFKIGGAVKLGDIWSPLRIPGNVALGIARPDPGLEVFGGIFLGQNMYTPKNIGESRPQPFDRPWAGWMYLGTVLQVVQPDGKVLDSVEFDIGMVGPASLAEQVQRNWHALIGAPEPRGWGNQLRNEPGFLLAYMHKRKVGTTRFDIIPHAGVTLGTVLTLARVGGIARFGHNLSGFGPDRIEPSGALLQNTRASIQPGGRPQWEYYGFVGADARYVAHNVFLDGTVFRDSPSVDKRHYVRDLSVGVSLRYRAWRVGFTRVHRSEEFTTPLAGAGGQSFFAFSLSYEPDPPAPK